MGSDMGGALLGSHGHLFEAVAVGRGSGCVGVVGDLQIAAQCLGGLEVWMDVRQEPEERGAPRCHSHIKFCRGVGLSLKIRPLQDNAADKMASMLRGQRVDVRGGHRWTERKWRN